MKDDKIFQVPCEFIKLETKSHKAIRIQFDSQEEIQSEPIKRLLDMRGQLGWLSFAVRQIESNDLLDLPEIKTDDKKTPAQRQRAVIFRIWERDPHGYVDFNLFYEFFMNKHIEWMKEKYLT